MRPRPHSRRLPVTLVLMTLSLCFLAWRAPSIIDRVNQFRAGVDPLSGVGGLDALAAPGGGSDMAGMPGFEALESLLNPPATGADASAKPGQDPGLVVFGAEGMTEEEKRRLMEQAERLRPRADR